MSASTTLGHHRLLTVTGTVKERAHQQGRVFAGDIPQAASAICSFFLPDRLVPAAVHQRVSKTALLGAGGYFYRLYRPVLAEHAEGKYERALKALARGAGVSRFLAFGLSGVPEVLAARINYFFPPGGCTSIVLAAEKSNTGSTQLLYNHDFPLRFGPFPFVRRNEATDALRSLCLTYPMTLGCVAGINEAGLAMAVNTAFVSDFSDTPLVFASHAAQEVIDRCTRVQEAVELLESLPGVATGLILSLADDSGDRAVVEMSCTQVRTRRPDGPEMVSVNKYRHPDMEVCEIPVGALTKGVIDGLDLHETNLVRQARLDRLLAQMPSTFGEAEIKKVMADHDGSPCNNTICRHFDMGETLATMVFDTNRRSLKISWGRACEAQYREIRLERRSQTGAKLTEGVRGSAA